MTQAQLLYTYPPSTVDTPRMLLLQQQIHTYYLARGPTPLT